MFQRIRTLATFLPLLLATTSLSQEPKIRIQRRADVRLRTIKVIVRNASGAALAAPPAPADLEVREDGRRVQIVAVEPIAPVASLDRGAATESSAAPVSAPPRHETLRQVLYLDLSTLSIRSPHYLASWIRPIVDRLAERGTLEIVAADPRPSMLLPPTSDRAQIAAAVERMSRLRGRDRLVEIRTQPAGAGSLNAGPGWISPSQKEEWAVIRGSLDTLREWASRGGATGGGVLFLASDGYDLSGDAYSQLPPTIDSSIASAHNNTAFSQRMSSMARGNQYELAPRALTENAAAALAGQGWILVPLAPTAHDRDWTGSSAEGSPGSITREMRRDPQTPSLRLMFERAAEPLIRLADVTGGEVATAPDKLVSALASTTSSLYLVTYEPADPADGKLRKQEVRSLRPELLVRAARFVAAGTPEDIADARVREILASEAGAFDGLALSVRIEPDAKTSHLFVTADLGALPRLLVASGSGRLRLTVAGFAPGEEPVPYHEEHALKKKHLDAGAWEYTSKIRWGKNAERIALYVEELTTGLSGGACVGVKGVGFRKP